MGEWDIIGGSCKANCVEMAEKRGRGRTKGYVMSNEHRTKIANSQILKYLLEHVEGKREMSATQIQAGVALIKKYLPDLQTTTLEGGEKPLETRVKVGWEK